MTRNPRHTSSACDYSETCSRKGCGLAQRSLDLIAAMHAVTRAAQPITGRGVGYKLFIKGLIASMARNEMARVYKPNTIITFQHGFPWPAITTALGQAAQNTETFKDHNIVRPVFGRAR